MTGLFLPGAKWLPVSYRAEAGMFAEGTPLGYIPHVQQGNGSLFRYFNDAVSPNRKFSNAWIAKDGGSEQYAELVNKPWAQVAGNALYWAFETEGFDSEPLTAAQINTLAIWHNFLHAPDVLAQAPGQVGVGTHAMGGAAWGGHNCPGAIRAAQRVTIIARAKALRHPGPPAATRPPAQVHPTGARLLVDGYFGPATIKALQRWAGVTADGVLGPVSWKAIQTKVGAPAHGKPDPITWGAIQRLTNASPRDGKPGPKTYRALQVFLNNH